MKTAIIYYSLEGNMDFIAKKISNNNNVHLYRLIPKKEYPKGNITKYIWGGKSATFGEKPKLINEQIEIDNYDTLIIGSPIWAGTFTPPLNTFFHDYHISGKNIILVTTNAGGNSEKCFAKMKSLLNDNVIVNTFQFVNPMSSQDKSTDEKIKQIQQLIG